MTYELLVDRDRPRPKGTAQQRRATRRRRAQFRRRAVKAWQAGKEIPPRPPSLGLIALDGVLNVTPGTIITGDTSGSDYLVLAAPRLHYSVPRIWDVED